MERIYAVESAGKIFGTRSVLRAGSVWGTRGRITVLFGRNGCGKSTLLKIGAGVLRPDHGTIRLHGRSYLSPRLEVLARAGLHYMPERPALPWTMPVERALAVTAKRWSSGKLDAVIERLRLAAFIEGYPWELSGGEQLRAALALAWIRAPDVLLADEPFSGVAPLDAELVVMCLREIASSGAAVIVTGHEVPMLMSIADEVVWLSGGSTHGLGTPYEASKHDGFRRDYLGSRTTARALRDPEAPGAAR